MVRRVGGPVVVEGLAVNSSVGLTVEVRRVVRRVGGPVVVAVTWVVGTTVVRRVAGRVGGPVVVAVTWVVGTTVVRRVAGWVSAFTLVEGLSTNSLVGPTVVWPVVEVISVPNSCSDNGVTSKSLQ